MMSSAVSPISAKRSLVIVSSCSSQGFLLGICDLLAHLLFALLEGKLHIPLVLGTPLRDDAVANPLILNCLRILRCVAWIFLDFGVCFRIHFLNVSTAFTCFNELCKVCLVLCRIFLL